MSKPRHPNRVRRNNRWTSAARPGLNPRALINADRRVKVAKLYLRAHSQSEIAVALGIGQATVSRDLTAIQAEWAAARVQDRQQYIERELRGLEQVEREAWAEWERSKLNAEETRTEDGPTGPKNTQISRGQCGDPRYMNVINDCRRERAKLLSMYPPPRAPVDEAGKTVGGVLAMPLPMTSSEWTTLATAQQEALRHHAADAAK